MNFKAIVVGGSAGGAEALDIVLSTLPPDFLPPILVVQHLHCSDDGAFSRHLARHSRLTVIEPCDKQPIESKHVYTAPADYHMYVEEEEIISLSVDPKVKWSRPSIDVLFESAARVWKERLTSVILSGANDDGIQGMRVVKAAGGHTIAQDPETALTSFMPQAAINATVVDEVLSPSKIGKRLLELHGSSGESRRCDSSIKAANLQVKGTP